MTTPPTLSVYGCGSTSSLRHYLPHLCRLHSSGAVQLHALFTRSRRSLDRAHGAIRRADGGGADLAREVSSFVHDDAGDADDADDADTESGAGEGDGRGDHGGGSRDGSSSELCTPPPAFFAGGNAIVLVTLPAPVLHAALAFIASEHPHVRVLCGTGGLAAPTEPALRDLVDSADLSACASSSWAVLEHWSCRPAFRRWLRGSFEPARLAAAPWERQQRSKRGRDRDDGGQGEEGEGEGEDAGGGEGLGSKDEGNKSGEGGGQCGSEDLSSDEGSTTTRTVTYTLTIYHNPCLPAIETNTAHNSTALGVHLTDTTSRAVRMLRSTFGEITSIKTLPKASPLGGADGATGGTGGAGGTKGDGNCEESPLLASLFHSSTRLYHHRQYASSPNMPSHRHHYRRPTNSPISLLVAEGSLRFVEEGIRGKGRPLEPGVPRRVILEVYTPLTTTFEMDVSPSGGGGIAQCINSALRFVTLSDGGGGGGGGSMATKGRGCAGFKLALEESVRDNMVVLAMLDAVRMSRGGGSTSESGSSGNSSTSTSSTSTSSSSSPAPVGVRVRPYPSSSKFHRLTGRGRAYANTTGTCVEEFDYVARCASVEDVAEAVKEALKGTPVVSGGSLGGSVGSGDYGDSGGCVGASLSSSDMGIATRAMEVVCAGAGNMMRRRRDVSLDKPRAARVRVEIPTLDRMISYDPARRVITVEAGMPLRVLVGLLATQHLVRPRIPCTSLLYPFHIHVGATLQSCDVGLCAFPDTTGEVLTPILLPVPVILVSAFYHPCLVGSSVSCIPF